MNNGELREKKDIEKERSNREVRECEIREKKEERVRIREK